VELELEVIEAPDAEGEGVVVPGAADDDGIGGGCARSRLGGGANGPGQGVIDEEDDTFDD